MKHNKIINQYLVLTGLFNLGAAMSVATYVTFLMWRGLDLFQVNLINVVFFTTMFFFEVPTGVFADRYGRKKSYVIACFLFSIGEIVYSFSYGVAGFICAEMLAGIGRTFANGAFHAWFVDTLKHHGFAGTTQPLFKKEQLVKQLSSVLGGIIGAYVGTIDLSYPWLVGGLIGIVSGCITWIVMKEEYFVAQKASIFRGLKDMLVLSKKSIVYVHGDRNLMFIVITSAFLLFSVQAPNMQWQPFFGKSFHSSSAMGYVWMGIALFVLAGIYVSSWIIKKSANERTAMIITLVTAGLGLLAATYSQNYILLSIMFFLLHEVPRGAFGPIKDAYLNDLIGSKDRATVISCQSAYNHLGCLVGLLVSGILAKQYSISLAWTCSGSLLVIVPLWFIFSQKWGSEWKSRNFRK